MRYFRGRVESVIHRKYANGWGGQCMGERSCLQCVLLTDIAQGFVFSNLGALRPE